MIYSQRPWFTSEMSIDEERSAYQEIWDISGHFIRWVLRSCWFLPSFREFSSRSWLPESGPHQWIKSRPNVPRFILASQFSATYFFSEKVEKNPLVRQNCAVTLQEKKIEIWRGSMFWKGRSRPALAHLISHVTFDDVNCPSLNNGREEMSDRKAYSPLRTISASQKFYSLSVMPSNGSGRGGHGGYRFLMLGEHREHDCSL
jgi:hypothetical protein